MPRITGSTFINAPPAEVFAFVGDATNNAAWHAHVEHTTWLDAGPMRVGRRGVQVSRMLGRTWSITAEIVEWDPPHTVAWKVVHGPALRTSIRVEPDMSGSRLTLVLDAGPRVGGALGRFVDRAAMWASRSQGEADFARLRAILEREKTSTSAA